MIDRRSLLAGLSCNLLPGFAIAEAPTKLNAIVAALPATEQIMYSTVRLSSTVNGVTHWGTSFLFGFFHQNGKSVAALITNHHVVDGLKDCELLFAGVSKDGGPDIDNHVTFPIQNIQERTVYHPSVDLAAILIGDVPDKLQQQTRKPFLITLDPSLIPTKDELKELTPTEQILTAGYPGQFWDNVHNLPVFHRGYTSTPAYVDFQGRPEFLIDITIWPGASGSPVFLFNEGGYTTRKQGTILGGNRTKLIGVVYGVGSQDVSGNVLIQNGPTKIVAPSSMNVPTNLGACISAAKILDFEPILVSRGVKSPDGYVMRAK